MRYAVVMHMERVTVSLPAEVAAAARQVVESGDAPSLSAYVAGAVRARLAQERGLAELAKLFGGPPPAEALDAVRRDFGLPPRDAEAAAKAS
jgi:antitoxin ParD1/3/4